MHPERLAALADLEPLEPRHGLVSGVDLVLVRWPAEDVVSVLYGRCLHRGALLSDGFVRGKNLVCGLHDWDYCYKTGVSAYANDERLKRFHSWVEDGDVFVDRDEIEAWELEHPQPFDREAYQGAYADPHAHRTSPTTPGSRKWPRSASSGPATTAA